LENENKKNLSKTDTPKEPEQIRRTVLSKQETENIVREFVIAWIEGDVKIDFPDVDFYMTYAKMTNEHLDFKAAAQKELEHKDKFEKLIAIIGGDTPSTKEEQEKAISQMFKLILDYRCGERIKGKFGKQGDFELRLHRIEEQIPAINTSIEQLIIWYRSLLQPRR
jgi:disulfide oxidoreductase YuzD